MLKKGITLILSITMFISGGMIPTFILLKQLNMFNTYWVMVLPGCVSAYNTFVFRSFFQGIPASLHESARVDGAIEPVIWARIILPLSKPLLATFFLFTMVGHWNSWFNALLYLTDKNRYPLQMVLRRLVVQEEMGTMYSDSTGRDFCHVFWHAHEERADGRGCAGHGAHPGGIPVYPKALCQGRYDWRHQGMITRAQAAFHKKCMEEIDRMKKAMLLLLTLALLVSGGALADEAYPETVDLTLYRAILLG